MLAALVAEAGADKAVEIGKQLHPVTVLPFVLLLLAIALIPLKYPDFWEKHHYKATVAALLAVPTVILLVKLDYTTLTHSMLEYFAFIVLLFSLFVVAGGIQIIGGMKATPRMNLLLLGIGALIANLVGTTGAAMLLVRPVLRINRDRKRKRHIPIFFIFIVCNIAGCLLPIGDPPLFLGYLRGVPFFWTLRLFPEWLLALALVMAVFYVMDTLAFRKEAPEVKGVGPEERVPLRLKGKINFLWLAFILLSVIFLTPERLAGWGFSGLMLYSREWVMLSCVALSVLTTKREIREANEFTYSPMIEVAVLFAGIFITMVPALLILEARGGEFGITQPWQFFWVTGALSSFLDNTPTYVTFLSLLQGLSHQAGLAKEVVGVPALYLAAVSTGAVFMGANSYIGNAPNFMVKAIFEEGGYKCPSFFGYMLYSAVVLVPIFVVVTLVFYGAHVNVSLP